MLVDEPPFDGLRLKANKNGSRTWIYRYRTKPPEKRLRQLKLGSYPTRGLSEAREEIQKQKKIRFEHGDPALYKRKCEVKEREEQKRVKQETRKLSKLIEYYLNKDVALSDIKEKTKIEIRRLLKTPELDSLKALSILELKQREFFEVLTQIKTKRSPGTAERIRQRLKLVFEFGLNSGYLPSDFTIPLPSKQIARTSNSRERFLSDDELKKLFDWLPFSGLPLTAKRVMLISLFTGCRSGEVVAARWKDINFSLGEWHILDTKNKRPHKVFLSPVVKALFDQIERRKSEWVFPSKDLSRHLGQKTVGDPIGKLRKSLDIPHWTAHDLRRTFATGVASLNADRTVVRRMLNHTGGSVSDIYDRHSYDTEALRYWGVWSDHVQSLIGRDDFLAFNSFPSG